MNRFLMAIICSLALAITACTSKDDFQSSTAVDDSNATASSDKGESLRSLKIGDRTTEEVLCQEGEALIKRYPQRDLEPSFSELCKSGKITVLLDQLIQSAYDGTNEVQLKILASESDERFVTNIRVAYAIKTPLSDPSLFAGLKPHDIFAAGISTERSELIIDVAERQSFPGRGSVERVRLNYNLKNANGAGIFDRRETEFNTYLLVEDNRDIILSTEHLVDGDTNRHYHRASGLIVGIKTNNNESYFVFISDLVIKNRIDPDRIAVTLNGLNQRVPAMLLEHIENSL